ncbi:VCBS repeat-containing protein [Streptomyces crystallinus]|uniref:Uncharacterized protein n=1 Tax=Streptomyces crystallinus TaxID=68191 RepID=A0ABN1GI72_9ACTN
MIGGGWQVYNTITGVGYVTGDGKADLVARDASGTLRLYQGTGNATVAFKTRTKIGGGWNTYTTLL